MIVVVKERKVFVVETNKQIPVKEQIRAEAMLQLALAPSACEQLSPVNEATSV
jgi:hypothetical protein